MPEVYQQNSFLQAGLPIAPLIKVDTIIVVVGTNDPNKKPRDPIGEPPQRKGGTTVHERALELLFPEANLGISACGIGAEAIGQHPTADRRRPGDSDEFPPRDPVRS